jgi:hypothetical protein
MADFKKDGDGERFELRFYSGYKGEETPRAVVIGNGEFKIEEILWRRRGFDQESDKKFEIFKCKSEAGLIKIVVYESGEWSISFVER